MLQNKVIMGQHLFVFSSKQPTSEFPALGGNSTNKSRPTNQKKAKPSKSKKEEVSHYYQTGPDIHSQYYTGYKIIYLRWHKIV